MEITIEKIVYPGRSLGRGEDGIAVFTEGGLPGERVEVRVTKNKKSFREAKIEKILQNSKERILPRCPSFGKCGGCTFQHTSYENQLKFKEAYVDELLSRFNDAIMPIVKSPDEWGYRNKMEFSFFENTGSICLGLHQKGEFDKYFAVPPCHIADPDFLPVSEIIKGYAEKSKLNAYNKKSRSGFWRHLVLRKAKNTRELLVNLVTNKAEHISESFFYDLVQKLKDKVSSFYWSVNSGISDTVQAEKLILLYGKKEIEEKLNINGRVNSFLISPFSFFQTNSRACEKLYQIVLELFEAQKNDSALDLYCGTGTIGIILAPYVEKVLGIDEAESAIDNAKINSANNNIANITFQSFPAEKWIKTDTASGFDCVIVDPPRSGLSGKVLDFLGKNNFKKMVYVSCNPSTLARDLELFTGRHGYQAEKIVPVDMFPQTYHVETVVLLKKQQ